MKGRSTRRIVRPARTPWRHSKSSSTTLRTSAFSPCSYSAAWGYQSRRNCRSSRPAVLSHEGIVRWWLALPLCLLGVFSGDVVLYWVGRHWGEQLLNWRMVRLVLSPAREQWLKTAYRRHALKTVVTARRVMGLRAAVFLTAGIARVPFWKFIVADAGGAGLGVPLGFGLVYFFTDQIEAIVADVHTRTLDMLPTDSLLRRQLATRGKRAVRPKSASLCSPQPLSLGHLPGTTDRFAPQGETIAETAIALDLIRGRRRIFDRTKFVLALPALGKLGGVGPTGRSALGGAMSSARSEIPARRVGEKAAKRLPSASTFEALPKSLEAVGKAGDADGFGGGQLSLRGARPIDVRSIGLVLFVVVPQPVRRAGPVARERGLVRIAQAGLFTRGGRFRSTATTDTVLTPSSRGGRY